MPEHSSAETVTRVVIHDELTRDAMEQGFAALGWQLTNIVAASAQQPAQLHLVAGDGDTPVLVIRDERLGWVYCVGRGEAARAALDEARGPLRCCSEDDDLAWLLEPGLDGGLALTRDPGRLVRGLGLLVLMHPEPDDRRVELMAAALELEDPRARAAALTAASYVRWPGLRGALEGIASGDPEPSLRSLAGQLLAQRT